MKAYISDTIELKLSVVNTQWSNTSTVKVAVVADTEGYSSNIAVIVMVTGLRVASAGSIESRVRVPEVKSRKV